MRRCGERQSHLTSSLVSWSAPALVPRVGEAWGRDPGAPGEQTGRAGRPAVTPGGRRARRVGAGQGGSLLSPILSPLPVLASWWGRSELGLGVPIY